MRHGVRLEARHGVRLVVVVIVVSPGRGIEWGRWWWWAPGLVTQLGRWCWAPGSATWCVRWWCASGLGAEQDNGSEGTRNPKPTTIHPMGTLTAAIVKKKEMTDQGGAKEVTLGLADSKCISCRGNRQRGVCAANCGGTTVHADILKALAATSL